MQQDQEGTIKKQKMMIPTWLNLDQYGLYKDVRKLIYKRLNKYDMMSVMLAHNSKRMWVIMTTNNIGDLMRLRYYNLLMLKERVIHYEVRTTNFHMLKSDMPDNVLEFLFSKCGDARFTSFIFKLNKGLQWRAMEYIYKCGKLSI
jgi:hypothetical protein